MTDHHRTHAVILALEEFDVRREVLCDQIIMRETHDSQLVVRINFARSDARKMFETAQTACALKPAQIDHRVAQDFAGRASVGARVETVGEQVALVRHNGHDGREVHVEAEHSQDFARVATKRASARQIAVLSNRARRRHRREDTTQTINEAALLIYPAEWLHRNERANAVKQRAQLIGRGDISSEDDDAAGLDVFDERACLRIEFCSGKTDVKELTDLLFKRK